MSIHNDIQYCKGLIEQLKIAHPELVDDEDLRVDTFEGETDLHGILSRLVATAIDAGIMAEAVKSRRDELAARQKRFTDKYENIRGVIQSLMERAELQKVQLVEATLSVRKIVPVPIVTDVDLLPENCVKIERKADMAAIKTALETLPFIDGVVMGNGKTSLTIRTK
jgi:Siphovirus Gp157